MPDIPRIYTAAAEWIACLLFIVSVEKKIRMVEKCIIMVGMLDAAVGFSGVNRKCADLFLDSVYDHRSISNDRVYLFVLRREFSGCRIFWYDCICCSGIYGIFGMADCMLLSGQMSCQVQGDKNLMLAAVYGAVSFLLWKLLQQHLPKDGKLNISFKEYFSAAVIVIAVFAVSNLSFVSNTGACLQMDMRLKSVRSARSLISVELRFCMRT